MRTKVLVDKGSPVVNGLITGMRKPKLSYTYTHLGVYLTSQMHVWYFVFLSINKDRSNIVCSRLSFYARVSLFLPSSRMMATYGVCLGYGE